MTYIDLIKKRESLLVEIKYSNSQENTDKFLNEFIEVEKLIEEVINKATVSIGDKEIEYKKIKERYKKIKEHIETFENYDNLKPTVKNLKLELIELELIQRDFECKYTFELKKKESVPIETKINNKKVVKKKKE